MSYNRHPSPNRSKSSSTRISSISTMAATQLPPLGPHVFSYPTQPIHRLPQPFHPSSVSPYSLPPFARVQNESRFHPNSNPPMALRPTQAPLAQVIPRHRQSAVPVASLLQSEPFSPPYRKLTPSPVKRSLSSPRSVFSVHDSLTTPPMETSVYRSTRQEPVSVRRRYSPKDEMSNVPLPPSPNHIVHRGSATPHYSSRTSSSDYITTSSAIQQPSNPLERDPRPQNL